jgi:uncharacterized membrane protein
VSAVGGAALAAYGLNKRSMPGTMAALAGAGLIYRGATAHCPVYERAGVGAADDTRTALAGSKGIIVEEAVTILAPIDELYGFWRNFENLPRFMTHLLSVRVLDPIASHWVARAPAGRQVTWDAEIINEVPFKVIGWRSVEGAQIVNAGSVNFSDLGERGTQVTVKLQYAPPGGKLGASLAWMFGEEPSIQIRDDLRRLKQIIEAGEVLTTTGQPVGGRRRRAA